jgi:nitrite reductase/ring-hydroxylating ferredoxin subunit
MTPHQLLMQQMAHLKQQKLTIQQLQLKLQNNMKSRLSGTTDLSTATEKSSSSNKLEPSVASVVHNNVESTRHVHGIPKKPMVCCYTVDDQQMDTLLDSSSMSSYSQSSSHWSHHPAVESVLSHDEAQLVMACSYHQLELQLQAKMLAYNQSCVMIHHHMQQQMDTLLVSSSLPSQPVAMPSFRIINVRTKNANGAWICMAEGCSKNSQGRTMSTKFSFCRIHHNMYLIQTGQVETWSCKCGNKVATTSDRCGMCHRWKKGMKPSERGQSFAAYQQQHPSPTFHHKDEAFIMNTPTPSIKRRPHLPTPHCHQLMQQQLKNSGNNASVPRSKQGMQQQQPVEEKSVVKKTKPNIKSPTMKKKWNHDVSKVSAKVMSFEGSNGAVKGGFVSHMVPS